MYKKMKHQMRVASEEHKQSNEEERKDEQSLLATALKNTDSPQARKLTCPLLFS